MKRVGFSLTLVIYCAILCNTQTVQYDYEWYTKNDGLPDWGMMVIAKDSTGFLWMVSQDLYRYDEIC